MISIGRVIATSDAVAGAHIEERGLMDNLYVEYTYVETTYLDDELTYVRQGGVARF